MKNEGNKNRIKRRDFLKTIGVGTLSLAFSSFTGPFVLGQEPIVIGASLSLTGKYARTGEEQRKGYELWAEFINKQGYSPGKKDLPYSDKPGLLGRPVKLEIIDDRSDATTGVRLYTDLIYDKKVDLLLGPYSSSITYAVSPVIEEAEIPTPNPMASSQRIWKGRGLKWQVQCQPPATSRLPGLCEIAAKKGDKTIAIIYSDTEFPRNSAEALKQRALDEGLEVVLYEAYPKGITDWTPVVSKAQATGADVLAGGGYLPDALGITKACKSVKYAPHIIALLVGVALPDFEGSLGEDALYVSGDSEWLAELAAWPGAQEYVQAYKAAYPEMTPEYHSAGGFGGAQILEESIKKAGTLEDREAIRDIMYALETNTIYSKYGVEPLESPDSGLQRRAVRFLIQVQEGLKKQVIYPYGAATAKLVYPFPGWG